MKAGDVVHIFTPDGKIERGTATIYAVDEAAIHFDGQLPAGTHEGDVLMTEATYKAWTDRFCHIPYIVSTPKSYFNIEA